MADRYKKRKMLRHVHFKKYYKSPVDFDNAVAHPPSELTPEQWLPICQFFTSPEFIACSKINVENRKNMQYPTTQGTKSMAERRHEKKNKGNFIETWKEVHTKKSSNTFVNQLAAQKYGELVSAYEKRANTPDVGMSVLSEVLGERHGHNRGVGRKLKGQSLSRNTQPTPTQDMPVDPRVEQKINKLTRLMLWMSQRLGPDVRLPTDEELLGMAMPQMSGGGSASSSQPAGTSQYHQAQQSPPFMYHLSSPPQMSPFPWMSSPILQMQVMNMQQTPETQQMQQHPLQMQQMPSMQHTSQLQQHSPQMQQRPSMQQTSQMQQPSMQQMASMQQPSMQQMASMQQTPQMQQASMQHMSSMQQTPQMQQPSMQTPHMQPSFMQHTPHVQQMTHMHQMSHLQQMPSMQQTPHTPSMPLMQHMAPTSQMQPLPSMQQMSHIQQPYYPQMPEVSQQSYYPQMPNITEQQSGENDDTDDEDSTQLGL